MPTVRSYNSFDLAKFIFSFAVVAIHTRPLIACDNTYILAVYNGLVFLAVPFFFVTSGYLLASKFTQPLYTPQNTQHIYKQLKKISNMYLFWMLAYTPLAIGHFILTNTSPAHAFLSYIHGFIFMGEQYNSWPLWYLLGTVYALVVIVLTFKLRFSASKLIIIWLSITAFSITLDFIPTHTFAYPLYQTIQLLIKYTTSTGRIFQGMIYIPIGMALYYKTMPKYISYMLFFGAGFLLIIYQNNIVLSDCFRIATATGLFGLIKNIRLKDRSCWLFMRKSSLLIYLLHMYIWTFYYTLVYGQKQYGVDSFLATGVLSFFTAGLWIYFTSARSRSKLPLN